MPATLGDRTLFPSLTPKAYLNHAAISPPSSVVQDAVAACLRHYTEEGMGAFSTYLERREDLRADLAALVGAQPDEIGLAPNTSWGVVFAAMCFPWEKGDGVVVLDGEFPTNVTPWQQAAELYGLRIHRIRAADFCSPDPGKGLAQLETALRAGAKLIAVSAVQFQTGLRMPLMAISALTHRSGAAVFVDAIQACGVVPLDFERLGVDLAACGSHKWLMGLEGAGFIYVRRALGPQLRPRLAAWLSHQDGLGFLFDGPGHLRYDRPLKTDASVIEGGAYNTLGFVALQASVGLIRSLGVNTIYDHVQAYHDALEPKLSALGLTSLRSPSPGERSGVLSFDVPEAFEPTRLPERLAARGVSVALPDGRLRCAPHWPNALGEVDLVAGALEEAIAEATAG
ncbi:MAG: aminotransferase class V-fold PLP-dependent enzyme [Nannocystaceae bacterium]|nr:aminotransferase class V-fold PLP-dependent enzyme [bacterium]